LIGVVSCGITNEEILHFKISCKSGQTQQSTAYMHVHITAAQMWNGWMGDNARH
jgi:hypothetical protein